MAAGGKNTAGWLTITIGILLSLIGACLLLLLPLTEHDSAGNSLRCGTALNRDEDAARAYELEQAERGIASALGELGETFGPQPEPAPPRPRTLPLFGEMTEDLEADCVRSLTILRSWSIALILLGAVIAIVGLVVRYPRLLVLIRQLVEGARLPTWMRTFPEWAQAALVSASGLAGGFAGMASGGWRLAWSFVTVAVFLFAILLSVARSAEAAQRDRRLSTLKEAHKTETQNLVGNELHSLVQITAEAVATEDHTDRCAAARAARAALTSAAAHLVGTVGTRANLFHMSSDRKKMSLAPGGFAGRGTRSSREFSAGDKTFDLAIVEQGRFVESAKDELVGDERDVPYQTFLTYPVSIGPRRVHGVLTVDSLTTGDFDQGRDMPIMAVLSALIAVTYECEKYQNPVV